MLKKLLNACLIVCMIGLSSSAIAAEEISKVQPAQQSEPESSRIFGGGGLGACISACLPAFGTPYYAACRLACLGISLKQE